MVTIIKPGTKKIAKCDKCGCEFSYEDEDVLTDKNRKYINCPQCHVDYVIEATKSTTLYYNDEYYKCASDR